MPSVIEARMKTADASISRSPVFSPAKRGVHKIQMSSGMAAMRVSVMELGRFTRNKPGTRRTKCDYPPHYRPRQRTGQRKRRECSILAAGQKHKTTKSGKHHDSHILRGSSRLWWFEL